MGPNGLIQMLEQGVPLGRFGLQVSQLAFGTAAVGNLYRAVSDADAGRALRAAYDSGISYFDTAPHYGLGLAESRLGDLVRSLPRDQIVISSKVGRLIRENPHHDGGMDDQGFMVPNRLYRVLDYSYDGVMTSIEESIERLGVDYIDVAFVHDPDDFEEEALEGAFVALEKLRSEGVIKSFGAGMNQSEMLARFVERTDLDVVMCAGRFSLLEQPALLDLLPIALERGVSVVAAGVFNSGILATESPEAGANYNYEPASEELIEKAQRMGEICQESGFSLPQVAAQFPLLHPAVPVVCLGARSREQAQRNTSLFSSPVSKDFYRHLADEGFLSLEGFDY